MELCSVVKGLRQVWGWKGMMAIALLSTPVLVTARSADAAPYPDRPGICYSFAGDSLEQVQSCVISTGYGTGVQYAVLNWPDGSRTRIMTEVSNEPGTITVDDAIAEDYMRDASWYNIVDEFDTSVETIFCNRVIETGNSVCYKFTD
ncbi:MAG: hypothetical protein MUF49_21150 [Oculatellaceae cyanobacterium Prado106]|nr:hypothetical protein [Oculatellaceae cyanobacterium Prado106]